MTLGSCTQFTDRECREEDCCLKQREDYLSRACHCAHCFKRIGIIKQVNIPEIEWQPIFMKCFNDLCEKALQLKELNKC